MPPCWAGSWVPQARDPGPSGSKPVKPAGNAPFEQVRDLIEELWPKVKAQVLARTQTVEGAVAALAAGASADDERVRAGEHEAHKLNGSLGTYGFMAASHAAAQVEMLLGSNSPQDRMEQLEEWVSVLRRQVDVAAASEGPP